MGSHPGWDVCEAPQPEIFCLFVQKPGLECGKDFGWFSPTWFFQTPVFWKRGWDSKFHSFWTRLKQEKNGSFSFYNLGVYVMVQTWVNFFHETALSKQRLETASNFLGRNFSKFVERSKTTYSPEKLTWPAGKSPLFNRRYIFKWLAFPLWCQFSGTYLTKGQWNQFKCSLFGSWFGLEIPMVNILRVRSLCEVQNIKR